MIQNFNVQGGPEYGRKNLPKLRAILKNTDIDGFLIPHEDEYQNEYLPDCNERLMWVTGFTGSAGAAVVTQDTAAVFVDGRYRLQVRAQVDPELFSYETLESGGVATWLKDTIKSGQRIGYDPRLHSPMGLKALRRAIENAGGILVPMPNNPLDTAWTDRPAPPVTPIHIQPAELAGETHKDKRARIGNAIKEAGCNAALITSPASIAWLLNIRGGDVMCTPLPLSTAVIDTEGTVALYVNPGKVTEAIRTHLGKSVSIHDESELTQGLAALSEQKVIVDPSLSSVWYFDTLRAAGAEVICKDDPVMLPKACKNTAELRGSQDAHKRDAVALIQFLHWLDTEAQSGQYDEIDAAQKLEGFRLELGTLKDLSFESISGAGSNGAVVHYRVSTATTQKLAKDTLYLIDSGGQYMDGTTDVTRTVPIGNPTAEMRERFTLVLQGHIALATAHFPEGTTGSNLDALARLPLWQKGLDYDHGTGHGVGVYLGVHEGPQRISKRPNNVAMRPGMIVSNEPGYYKTGEYGIRIENLQFVTALKDRGGEREMMGFETLTLAPIHRGLIDIDILRSAERDYIDNYHKTVWDHINPTLNGDVKDWLRAACAPL